MVETGQKGMNKMAHTEHENGRNVGAMEVKMYQQKDRQLAMTADRRSDLEKGLTSERVQGQTWGSRRSDGNVSFLDSMNQDGWTHVEGTRWRQDVLNAKEAPLPAWGSDDQTDEAKDGGQRFDRGRSVQPGLKQDGTEEGREDAPGCGDQG